MKIREAQATLGVQIAETYKFYFENSRVTFEAEGLYELNDVLEIDKL